MEMTPDEAVENLTECCEECYEKVDINLICEECSMRRETELCEDCCECE